MTTGVCIVVTSLDRLSVDMDFHATDICRISTLSLFIWWNIQNDS
jgi:hypothetical protein